MVQVKENICDFCGTCVSICPTDAIELFETMLMIVYSKCIECKNCIQICPLKALEWSNEKEL